MMFHYESPGWGILFIVLEKDMVLRQESTNMEQQSDLQGRIPYVLTNATDERPAHACLEEAVKPDKLGLLRLENQRHGLVFFVDHNALTYARLIYGLSFFGDRMVQKGLKIDDENVLRFIDVQIRNYQDRCMEPHSLRAIVHHEHEGLFQEAARRLERPALLMAEKYF